MGGSTLSPEQLDGPALPPPPGVVPQFGHPPASRAAGEAVQKCCIVLVTLAFIMRLYTRTRVIHRVDKADYTIILSWVLFLGYSVPCWLFPFDGAGIHQWDVQLKTMPQFWKTYTAISILYNICVFFVKTSILFEYISLFAPAGKIHPIWWYCYSLIAVNFIFHLIRVTILTITCVPLTKPWDPSIQGGHCKDNKALSLSQAIFDLLSDLSVLYLPQPIIWKMKVSRRRKIGISVIFLLGVLTCSFSVLQLTYAVKHFSTPDYTFYIWHFGLWTYTEVSAGIIVACLPVSLAFYQHVVESRYGETVTILLNRLRCFGIKPGHGRDPHSSDGTQTESTTEVL